MSTGHAQALADALPGVGLAVETGWAVLTEAAYTRRTPDDLMYYREVRSVFDEDEPIVKLLALSTAHTADEMAAIERRTLSNDEDGVAAVLEQLYG
ncbi:hypothetical protein ACTWPT_53955 [Nonomuraea sp. 3N208]|uniref:hypothetical protein n=1 Tax=Nonomuraea sp. 3N208 TaxID=3457421 RepID=UPI003FD335C0